MFVLPLLTGEVCDALVVYLQWFHRSGGGGEAWLQYREDDDDGAPLYATGTDVDAQYDLLVNESSSSREDAWTGPLLVHSTRYLVGLSVVRLVLVFPLMIYYSATGRRIQHSPLLHSFHGLAGVAVLLHALCIAVTLEDKSTLLALTASPDAAHANMTPGLSMLWQWWQSIPYSNTTVYGGIAPIPNTQPHHHDHAHRVSLLQGYHRHLQSSTTPAPPLTLQRISVMLLLSFTSTVMHALVMRHLRTTAPNGSLAPGAEEMQRRKKRRLAYAYRKLKLLGAGEADAAAGNAWYRRRMDDKGGRSRSTAALIAAAAQDDAAYLHIPIDHTTDPTHKHDNPTSSYNANNTNNNNSFILNSSAHGGPVHVAADFIHEIQSRIDQAKFVWRSKLEEFMHRSPFQPQSFLSLDDANADIDMDTDEAGVGYAGSHAGSSSGGGGDASQWRTLACDPAAAATASDNHDTNHNLSSSNNNHNHNHNHHQRNLWNRTLSIFSPLTTSSPTFTFTTLLQLFAYQDVLENGTLDACFHVDHGENLGFYIPQLLSFLLHGAYLNSEDLERFLLEKCRENLHFAHLCFWFLRAWCLGSATAASGAAVAGKGECGSDYNGEGDGKGTVEMNGTGECMGTGTAEGEQKRRYSDGLRNSVTSVLSASSSSMGGGAPAAATAAPSAGLGYCSHLNLYKFPPITATPPRTTGDLTHGDGGTSLSTPLSPPQTPIEEEGCKKSHEDQDGSLHQRNQPQESNGTHNADAMPTSSSVPALSSSSTSASQSYSNMTIRRRHRVGSKFNLEEHALLEDLLLRVADSGECNAKQLHSGLGHGEKKNDSSGQLQKQDVAPPVGSEEQGLLQAVNRSSSNCATAMQSDSDVIMQALAGDAAASDRNGIPLDPHSGHPSRLHLASALAEHRLGLLPSPLLHHHHSQEKTTRSGSETQSLPLSNHAERKQNGRTNNSTATASHHTAMARHLFFATPRFLDALTSVADDLMFVSRDQRTTELRHRLKGLEVELLPSNVVYIPIGFVYHRVWRIVTEESIALSTKERVPCIVTMEVVDYNFGSSSSSSSTTMNTSSKSIGENEGRKGAVGAGATPFSSSSRNGQANSSSAAARKRRGKPMTEREQIREWCTRKRPPQRHNTLFDIISNYTNHGLRKIKDELEVVRQQQRGEGGSGSAGGGVPVVGGLHQHLGNLVRRKNHGSADRVNRLERRGSGGNSSSSHGSSMDEFHDAVSTASQVDSVLNDQHNESEDDLEFVPLITRDAGGGAAGEEEKRTPPRDLNTGNSPSGMNKRTLDMGQWGSPKHDTASTDRPKSRPKVEAMPVVNGKDRNERSEHVKGHDSPGDVTASEMEPSASNEDSQKWQRNHELHKDNGSSPASQEIHSIYGATGSTGVARTTLFDEEEGGAEYTSQSRGVVSLEEGTERLPSKGGSKPRRTRAPPVVFKEDWATKEKRIRAESVYGEDPGWRLLPILIKSNDDLRQEQLASQLIQRMAAILARAKVPVWLYPYEIIALTDRGGIIEAVPDTISLDSLKRNDPSFTSLKNFFLDHFGPVKSDPFADAKANFVESLAAYSMVCFLLQIKDRHNGNILLDNKGHIVHIDFGFFFLSSPGKNSGFESAPFKLTRDFVKLMDGPTSRTFARFRELCIRTFLELRKNCYEIILLVEMIMEGNEDLPCFRGRPEDAVRALRERFRLDLNDNACVDYVNSLVDESMENWRTRWYDRYQRVCVGVL